MISDELKAQPTVAALLESYPDAVAGANLYRGQVSVEIPSEQIIPVLEYLKREHRFERLSGITAVDWYPSEPRFEVVYLLHSLSRNERVRLKCRVSADQEIESATSVWAGANWYEREVFDLFGVRFRNHPNLTRIMMPDSWEGHPLRRDYPTHGHRYDYASE